MHNGQMTADGSRSRKTLESIDHPTWKMENCNRYTVESTHENRTTADEDGRVLARCPEDKRAHRDGRSARGTTRNRHSKRITRKVESGTARRATQWGPQQTQQGKQSLQEKTLVKLPYVK